MKYYQPAPGALTEQSNESSRALRSMIMRKRKRDGDMGEHYARHMLTHLWVKQIERIHTPWRIHRNGGRIIGATPMGKVSADFRGIMDTGRSVMAECKERKKALAYTDLEPHQHEALAVHGALGGLSLVIWICPDRFGMIAEYVAMKTGGWTVGHPLRESMLAAQPAWARMVAWERLLLNA